MPVTTPMRVAVADEQRVDVAARACGGPAVFDRLPPSMKTAGPIARVPHPRAQDGLDALRPLRAAKSSSLREISE